MLSHSGITDFHCGDPQTPLDINDQKKLHLQACKHNFFRSLMPSIGADASRRGHQESCHNSTCAISWCMDTSACSCRLCSSGRRGGRFLDYERPAGRGCRGGIGERAHASGTGNDRTFVNRRDKANRGSVLNLSCLTPFHLHVTDSRTGREEVDGDETSECERNNNLNPFRGGLKPRKKKFLHFFHLSISFDKIL